jgi:hypothetical protein
MKLAAAAALQVSLFDLIVFSSVMKLAFGYCPAGFILLFNCFPV